MYDDPDRADVAEWLNAHGWTLGRRHVAGRDASAGSVRLPSRIPTTRHSRRSSSPRRPEPRLTADRPARPGVLRGPVRQPGGWLGSGNPRVRKDSHDHRMRRSARPSPPRQSTFRPSSPGCARPSRRGRTRDVDVAQAAAAKPSSGWSPRTRPTIADALAQDLGRKPFEAWLADIASTAAEAQRRRQERRQVDQAQAPAAGAGAAARPRLDRVRAVRHGARHRRVELPVRVDARARRRCHRRGKHRRAQAVRGGARRLRR